MERWLRRAWYWPLLALATSLALMLLVPEIAFARGGGGGHSGGGGGGGHSGGGGGGGYSGGGGGGGISSGGGGYYGGGGFGFGFGSITMLIFVIVIVGIIMVARSRYAAAPAQTWAPATSPDASEQGLAEIKAADPGFDRETFLQRAEMAFFLVKKAWQNATPAAGMPYLSPELFRRWSTELEQLIASQQRALLENLNVRGMRITTAGQGAGGDGISVRFDFVASSYVIDQAGKVVAGKREDQVFAEDWSFGRAPGVKTLASGGVTDQKCPNCGAPLALNEVGECRHCAAPVTSGTFDWVIRDIEAAVPETEDWGRTAVPGMAPEDGFSHIKANDPDFDAELFADRARKAFFQLEQAWQDRNVDEGRLYMSPGLYMSWSAQVEQMVQLHKRNVLENLGIRSMPIVKVVPGTDYDEMTVAFNASCADYEVDETTNKVVFGDRSARPFTEYWTFQRSSGARTIKTGGVVDKTCPNCGAPLNINQVGECTYCKAGVTSGKFDWVLSRIEQEEEWRG